MLSNLHPQLQAFVQEKWKGFTDIQLKAFEPIYDGQNCTIEAPTSGGKTEAVLFPLLSRIKPDKNSGFKILYIAPLKALLNDLASRVIPYAEKCSMQAFKWHGDVSQTDKVKQMVFPADILLTTPESIEAILLRKANWNQVFSGLQTIVIDEAHYFAGSERGSHLVSLLERIDAQIEKKPQRIAVTATIGNPDELLKWMLGTSTDGLSIRAESRAKKERDFLIHYFPDDGDGLYKKLYQYLPRKKSIVFERSRSKTEETAAKIHDFDRFTGSRLSVQVQTHHSSIGKRRREEAETSIKQKNENSLDAIICTSTLELGIDIGELDQVIQVGGLHSSGSFLQRVGRTGRRPGKPQFFRGLCSDQDELLLLAASVSLGWKHSSEAILFPRKAFHILAHQIICLCLQNLGTTAEDIWKILSKVYCFSGITRDDFDLLIDFMVQEDYLRYAGRSLLITSNKSEQEFLRVNWKRLFAIFDTGSMYNVVDGKKMIGTLDTAFAQTLNLPFVFVLGGQEWNALKIDHQMQQILVEKNLTGKAPKWKAYGEYDVPFEVAQEAGKILTTVSIPLFFLDPDAHREIRRQQECYSSFKWKAGTWLLDSSNGSDCYIWTFAGDKINRTLALLSEHEFGAQQNYDYRKIHVKCVPDDVSVEDLKNWLDKVQCETAEHLTNCIQEQIKVRWFSKFSECLPDLLAKKAIQDRSVDIDGLLRELKTVAIRTEVQLL